MTWTKVIALALVESGIVGRGQVANAAQAAFGMDKLNLLLDELDGKGLALPSFSIGATFNTVAGRALYLLGSGNPNDYSFRPETIVTMTCTISTNPISLQEVLWMDFPAYQRIPTPLGTTGQPWNYAINETWPQMGLYLYPTPNAAYPISITAKVKWIDTVGAPDLNPFTVAQVQSGYASGLVDCLSLRLAQTNRLETETLINRDRDARFTMASAIMGQQREVRNQVPVGLFGIDILTAGRNP